MLLREEGFPGFGPVRHEFGETEERPTGGGWYQGAHTVGSFSSRRRTLDPVRVAAHRPRGPLPPRRRSQAPAAAPLSLHRGERWAEK